MMDDLARSEMFDKFHRQSESPLNVVVVTPTGEGGRGGLDCMVDAIRHELRELRAAACISCNYRR